jgi:hypothetical protein
MRISRFKIFETFTDMDVNEAIESCKDLIETFSEYNDNKYMVYGYKSGYSDKDGSGFEQNASSEDRLKCVKFNIGIPEFTSIESGVDIDKFSELIKASKPLYSKLKLHCDKVKYKIDGCFIYFSLLFDNIDDMNNVKVKRIYGNIKEVLRDYMNSKRIRITNKSIDFYRNLNDMLIDGGFVEKGESCEISYSTQESITDNILTINLNNFALGGLFSNKEYRKKFKPSLDIKNEVLRLLNNRIMDNYRVSKDGRSIKSNIKDGKLMIVIK